MSRARSFDPGAQGLERARIARPPQGVIRLRDHAIRRVLAQREQRVGGIGLAKRPERLGDGTPHLGIRMGGIGDERGARRRCARLAERRGRFDRNGPERIVRERRGERLAADARAVLRERLRCAHAQNR
jgi:hypothetical protein